MSNTILLTLLGTLATLLTGLPEHGDTRGCVMDYCQDPIDIVEAFSNGVRFDFCNEPCRRHLERHPDGPAILAVAERLTARPFGYRPPSIVISYARDDATTAERLTGDLQLRGHDVWRDTYRLRPGEAWEPVIHRELARHDFVVFCLSRATEGQGRFFHQEVSVALEIQRQRGGDVYAVPVRVEPCDPPSSLAALHHADFFPDWGAGLEALLTTFAAYRRP